MEEKDYWVVEFGNLNIISFEELEDAMSFVKSLRKGTLLNLSFDKGTQFEIFRQKHDLSIKQVKESEIKWQLS